MLAGSTRATPPDWSQLSAVETGSERCRTATMKSNECSRMPKLSVDPRHAFPGHPRSIVKAVDYREGAFLPRCGRFEIVPDIRESKSAAGAVSCAPRCTTTGWAARAAKLSAMVGVSPVDASSDLATTVLSSKRPHQSRHSSREQPFLTTAKRSSKACLKRSRIAGLASSIRLRPSFGSERNS
jgi:hypothetical protein